MNQPARAAQMAPAVEFPDYVTNQKLRAWVTEVAGLTRPDRVYLVRRHAGGIRPPRPGDGRLRDDDRTEPAETPRMFPRALRSRRCRADGGTHVRLQPQQGRCGAQQQLGRSHRDAREARRPFRRVHAWSHDVRDPLQHGPTRFAYRAYRSGNHRLSVCRREHAHHDAHRTQSPRRARSRRLLRAVPAFRRRSARAGTRRTPDGRATRNTSTSFISRKTNRSGRSAAVTAATRCSARSASLCGSPPSWRANRVGSRSIC